MAFSWPGQDMSMPGGDGVWGAVANIGSSLLDYTLQSKLMKKQSRAMRGINQGGRVLGFSGSPVTTPGGMGWGTAALGGLAGLAGGLMYSDQGDQSLLGQGIDWLQGQSGQQGCFKTSDPSKPRVTPCRTIQAVGPNGKIYEWVYRGRPVLYSGDVSTCRRVNKLLGRAGRSAARRTKSRCR